MTVTSSPAGEHAGARHTVDTLTSDALDELYDERDRLRAKVAEFDHIINWHTTCASCARILDSAYQETARAEKAEAALATLRKEQDEYEETVVGDLNETVIGFARQAARAEAAIARVRKATATSFMAGPNAVDVVRVTDVLAALDEPKES